MTRMTNRCGHPGWGTSVTGEGLVSHLQAPNSRGRSSCRDLNYLASATEKTRFPAHAAATQVQRSADVICAGG